MVVLKLILMNVLLGFSRDPYYEPTTVVHDRISNQLGVCDTAHFGIMYHHS